MVSQEIRSNVIALGAIMCQVDPEQAAMLRLVKINLIAAADRAEELEQHLVVPQPAAGAPAADALRPPSCPSRRIPTVWDLRLREAKALIDECLREWPYGFQSEWQEIINDSFQVDNEGRVSAASFAWLPTLHVGDDRWRRAMKAITGILQVTGATGSFWLYERVGNGERFEDVPLDTAAV